MFEFYSDSNGIFYSLFSGLDEKSSSEKIIESKISESEIISQQNSLINSIGKTIIGLLVVLILLLMFK